MAADHGIGEMEILDDGLQFSVMMTGDPAAEDEGQFVGLTNGAIGIEEPLFEGIDGSATTENEVIAELGLGKEQTMLNSSVRSLLGGEERRETGQPFLGARNANIGSERIGELLQGLRIGAT
jgi:hypothetical protein